MPFTVSHIAAVLPGHRWLSRAQLFTAAVIGSMVPDFGFLLPWAPPARWETHSFSGLFTFCLPVGFVTYFLSQLLIRPAVIEVLGDRAYARLCAAQSSISAAEGPSLLWVAGALLLGAATHLIWDHFTHENAHLFLPGLNSYVLDFFGHPVVLYYWLQLVSSVVGLLLVIAAVLLWLHHAPRSDSSRDRKLTTRERRIWIVLYLLPPVSMVLWVIWRVLTWKLTLAANWVAASAAMFSLRGAAFSLLLVSALLLLRLRLVVRA